MWTTAGHGVPLTEPLAPPSPRCQGSAPGLPGSPRSSPTRRPATNNTARHSILAGDQKAEQVPAEESLRNKFSSTGGVEPIHSFTTAASSRRVSSQSTMFGMRSSTGGIQQQADHNTASSIENLFVMPCNQNLMPGHRRFSSSKLDRETLQELLQQVKKLRNEAQDAVANLASRTIPISRTMNGDSSMKQCYYTPGPGIQSSTDGTPSWGVQQPDTATVHISTPCTDRLKKTAVQPPTSPPNSVPYTRSRRPCSMPSTPGVATGQSTWLAQQIQRLKQLQAEGNALVAELA